jgi:hypothetical protein
MTDLHASHLLPSLTCAHINFVSPKGGDALPALLPDDGDLMMVPGSETGHVEEASEYRFFLYRHWSLYDAMYHSPYVASKLGVWNQQGTVKLQVRIGSCFSMYALLSKMSRINLQRGVSHLI